MQTAPKAFGDKLTVFIAEGFGIGRIPLAPGTFGTALGFVWIYLLLVPRNLWIYLAGIVGGFFFAVWVGHRAEKILGKEDPGSIVIDEITAIPLAFLPAVLMHSNETFVPSADFYLSSLKLSALPLLTFALFRLFDVWKPLGIARIQNVPRGYGLVLDDFLAAIPSALLLYVYMKIAG
ncbi:MAG TPA: phosphatidylglycerophosphatase A [Verrucomicrobiae bacterium]